MAVRDALNEALGLPPAERGHIVRHLIDSLDREEDPAEVERAWAAELELRASQAIAGESSVRDLDEVCAELETKRPSRK
jgi:putative addiction module component (TIGR02574 family)